jgi:hypothetical protein
MANVNLQLVLYGLLAMLSPLGFAATLAVLQSGRFKALGFGIGFVAGQLLACGLLVMAGTAVVPDRETGHDTLRGLLAIGFGIAVLWLALNVRRRPPSTTPRSSERSQAVLARLGRLRIGTALVAGLLLGIGGPKRLVLTALAAASISASSADASRATLSVVVYTAIATLLCWAPILAFVVLGDRALARLGAAQEWLTRHQRTATSSALLLIGALAIAEGVASLL